MPTRLLAGAPGGATTGTGTAINDRSHHARMTPLCPSVPAAGAPAILVLGPTARRPMPLPLLAPLASRRRRMMTRTRSLAVFGLMLVLGAESLHAAAAEEIEAQEIVTAPVVLDGVRVMRVGGLSHFPAEERAGRVADRIVAAARDPAVDPAMLRIVEIEAGSEILAGARRLIVVSDADAEAEHVPRAALAAAWQESVHAAIDRYRADRTPAALLRGTLAVLVIAASLLVVLFLLSFGGARL